MHNILKQVILITPYPKAGLTHGDLFVITGEDICGYPEMEFIGQIHRNTGCTKTYDERMKDYFESSIKEIAETIKGLGKQMERYRDILIDMEN